MSESTSLGTSHTTELLKCTSYELETVLDTTYSQFYQLMKAIE